MTKMAAILSGLCLVVLVGGTALYTVIGARTDLSSCGISAGLGTDLGGPFMLIDSTGRPVTDTQVITRPSLVYFGYTFCPDVCPFDMARNAQAIDLLDESGVQANLIFVTIDPDRDTPDVLAQYMADLHPRMIALTGSDQQIEHAAALYRVQYARGEGEGEFYLMDHSTATYLILPGNRFGGTFRRDDTAETIAEKSACLINKG